MDKIIETYSAKKYAERYFSGQSGKPNGERDEAYYRRLAEHIYSQYCANALFVGCGGVVSGTGDRVSIAELRSYGTATQSTRRYKKILDFEIQAGDNPNAKQSLLNIAWDNVAIFPKFRDIAATNIAASTYAPVVRTIDTAAQQQRKSAVLKDKLLVDPRMRALHEVAGIDPGYSNPVAQGASKEDIDTMEALGGYSLPVEVALEDAVNVSLESDDFHVIKRMMSYDLVDLNVCAAYLYWSTAESRVRYKYVDPQGIIVPSSAYNDCRDIPFVGVIEHQSLSSLRQEVELDEKTWYKISKEYSSYYPNIGIRRGFTNMSDLGWRQNYLAQNNCYPYDTYTLCVMKIWSIEHENRDGVMVQTVHKAKWIVGTEIVFDYGEDTAIVRVGAAGNKTAALPVVVWKGEGPSITARCLAHIDGIQMAALKIRALFANLPPGPRMGLDQSVMLDSIKIGQKEYGILDIIGIYQSTGKFIIQSQSEWGVDGAGANKRPIFDINGDAVGDYNMFSTEINQQTEYIRQSTGLNEVVDGSANPNDLLVGTMKGMQGAANTALAPYMNGMMHVVLRVCSLTAKKIQSALVHGQITLRHLPLNSKIVRVVTLTEDMAFYEIEVSCAVGPTNEDIMMFTQTLVTRAQEGKISQADMFIVQDFLRLKNLKAAQFYLAAACAKAEALASARGQANIEAQAKANQQVAVAAEQAKQTTISIEAEGKMKVEQVKHEHRMEEMKLQASLGLGTSNMQASGAE